MSLRRVVIHELRDAWRSRAIAPLAFVIAFLLIGAAAVGHSRSATDAAQRARFQALVEQQWDEQPDRHPHRVSHYGYLLFRPRSSLMFFDTGVETFTGSSIFLEAHRQNSANFSEASYADGSRRFGELTMAMVLQLFVPLLLFAAAGVAVTREREAGTLWLLLCQGTPWRTFLWGKLAGALVVVGCALIPGVLGAAGWLIFASGSGSPIVWRADEAARVALLMAVHAAYLVSCAAGAILVSALHRTSRGALVTLVGAWIFLWIALPRALPGIAASLYPLPDRAAFEATVERHVRALGDSHIRTIRGSKRSAPSTLTNTASRALKTCLSTTTAS
jgi:ABC-2 type transport system permease protein